MNAIPFKVEKSEKGAKFNRYYFHCVDCGAEFVTGRYGKNTKPYCIDCEKKYEREKAKERIRRKETVIRNQAIDEFVEQLKERLRGMQMAELQGEDVCPCSKTGEECPYIGQDIGCQYCAREQTIKDIDEIAKQMKAGGK